MLRRSASPRALGESPAFAGLLLSPHPANACAIPNRAECTGKTRSASTALREPSRDALQQSAGAVSGARDIAALDGVEGSAARAYFTALMAFNRSPFVWPGRVKHPATDPLNAMLSFTYTLLMNEFTALLEGAGLDPYLGFLHQVDYGRPSLALDLMEPFRHPVADRFVLTMVNRGIFDATDFRDRGDRPGTFLASGAMKRFLAEYERWMLARPPRQEGPPAPRFRDLLRTEVEHLVAALSEGASFVPFRFDAGGKMPDDDVEKGGLDEVARSGPGQEAIAQPPAVEASMAANPEAHSAGMAAASAGLLAETTE
jgi:hypothetical protein